MSPVSAAPGQSTVEVGVGPAVDSNSAPGSLWTSRISHEHAPFGDNYFASGVWLAGTTGLRGPRGAAGVEIDLIAGDRRWRTHGHIGVGGSWMRRSEGESSPGVAALMSLGVTRAIDHRVALAMDGGVLLDTTWSKTGSGETSFFIRLGVLWSWGF
jgi:hypothetical protein